MDPYEMDPYGTPSDEPAEHRRFAAHLKRLAEAGAADEMSVISAVLRDPDRTMAQSAVVRHLDLRAERLHLEPAYEPWRESMALAVVHHPFLTRRLEEWTLLRVIVLKRPWSPDALLASSDWLQRKVAAASRADADAVGLLAERGRTRRVRHLARTTGRDQRRAVVTPATPRRA
ncbi:hypothetical protein [Streptomyces similanensis]|uniref:Uncharacterized protein n=1 Tax=Streptomyces similanensis TaxID=1274988 RepID=A0ABP9LDX6_9ACTN